MRRGLLAALAVAVLLALALAQAASAAGPTIALTTDPPLDQIVPDLTLAKVRIEVKDETGKPIPNVRIGFDLIAPKSSFISTDFPVVEGTKLMNYELVAPQGAIEFTYLWPIRGKYDVILTAKPTEGSPVQFEPIRTQTSVSLNENPAERSNAVAFVAILAAFGLLSGLILGRSLRVKREAE